MSSMAWFFVGVTVGTLVTTSVALAALFRASFTWDRGE